MSQNDNRIVWKNGQAPQGQPLDQVWADGQSDGYQVVEVVSDKQAPMPTGKGRPVSTNP